MATRIVVDCSNGVVEEIELTEQELAQREADRIAFEQAEEARKAEQALRNAKRAALLDRLGLTEDEAAVLFS